MEKLFNRVSNVLNITFKGNYASRDGVSFRRGTQASVMVGSTVYSNVYGLITNKISDADMKNIANNIAAIDHIGKLIKAEMRNTQVKPHGRWFITSNTVRTQVQYKHKIYNVAYAKDTGKQIGKLKLIPSSEVKPASIPTLRIVKKQEEQATASPQFDRDRFNKYVQLVVDFRKYYKVNAEKLLTAKLNNEKVQQLDLNDPKKVLHAIIDQVRKMNGKEYKVSIETEVDAIINKVNKIKEERKESASAGSSLPKNNKTNKGEKK